MPWFLQQGHSAHTRSPGHEKRTLKACTDKASLSFKIQTWILILRDFSAQVPDGLMDAWISLSTFLQCHPSLHAILQNTWIEDAVQIINSYPLSWLPPKCRASLQPLSRAHRFSKHAFLNYGPEEGTAQASGPEQDLGHPPTAARSYYWAMAQGRPCRRRTEHSKGTLAPAPAKGTQAPRTRLCIHRWSLEP